VIQRLFDASSQRTKLYIAIALNCGWTAADIATLTHDMLDWKTGILSRERNKTGVPTSFRLWEITLSLLGAEMTPQSDGLMLLGQNGRPLIHQKILPDGKPMAQTSAIRLGFDRVRRKTGLVKAPGFKAFRKTSAQLIEQHFTTEPHLVDQFLGHAYGNRVREAYTTGSFGRIHEVCDWLGKQYDLTACVTG
jgi:integrase